ncbi:MAG: PglZ domain-containing protein [Candidatus Desulfofervidaceae bacterium]|nr:PglZ domain-containing protein [Candidatus Desulfofervidaceae bacterium]
MGKVTDELIALLEKQIQDHGIVVWYDPEGHYTKLIENLKLPDTKILKYKGSFFELRYLMEPFLEFVDENGNISEHPEIPPRLLIYVPLSRCDTEYALIETESYGVIMEPGASHWQHNTRLKVIAERVFKKLRPEEARAIANKVEEGTLSLEDLDRLAEQSSGLGTLKLIFDATAPEEILLRFLSLEEFDREILNKQALPELCELSQKETGFYLSPEQSLPSFKEELARNLLLAEFVLKIKSASELPEALTSISIPESATQQKFILELCRLWRNRSDLRESYVKFANEIEKSLPFASLGIEQSVLTEIETFAGIEEILLAFAETQILEGKTLKVIELSEKRKQSFWSRFKEEYKLRWLLLKTAAQLIQEAERIENELKTTKGSLETLVKAYVYGLNASPWYMLDRLKRRLEVRYAKFDLKIDDTDSHFEEVMLLARRRYHEAACLCAEWMAKAIEKEGLNARQFLRQSEICQKRLKPLMSEGKTAYILADALRYEMGLDLVEGLEEEFEIKVEAALAQPPTITEVGMAALMPGADRGMKLVSTGASKVGIYVGDTLLKDRASRVKYFASSFQGKVLVLKLKDLIKPNKRRRDEIKQANLILITSQEIDRRGEESEDGEEARVLMEEVLVKLRQGIRILASLGVKNILITADHGFVFLDEMDESMKIDPPGGKTLDLHPRVWIGRGGSSSPFCVRLKAEHIGLNSEFEFVFPRGLACFRVRGGSSGYFHGGLSLPELVVPVIFISPKQVQCLPSKVNIKFGKEKITNRFFTIEVSYIPMGLFQETTKKVKVVVKHNKSIVGEAVTAAYGFEEGSREILLEKDRPNSVTIMLEDAAPDVVSIHILDAKTEVELAALKNLQVELTI